MATTILSRAESLDKWRKWKNRNPDYPLCVNGNGQWCKKIRGRINYFGVLDDPDEALRLYLEEKDFLLAGQEPPSRHDGLTVAELLDEHQADCEQREKHGRFAATTLGHYRRARKCFESAGLLQRPVDQLGPLDFSRLHGAINDYGWAAATRQSAIVAVRTVLKWGASMKLCKAADFGPNFKAPSLNELEAEREANGTERFFDREALLKLIKAADDRMRVAILLGLNCGFYASDSVAITLDHLHLDESIPYHNFRRVKTKRRRMAVLWPETVKAIRAYLLDSRRPVDPNERRLILTRAGAAARGRSAPVMLAERFDRLAERVGATLEGASLGSLRHTYATVAGLSSDQAIIDLTMGHAAGSSQGRRMNLHRRFYAQRNLGELERLKAVAEVVRKWLYKGTI